MAMKFHAIDPEVARQQLAKKQRTSKHRETLASFYEAGIPAAMLELEPNEDGTEANKNSVASGLGNALKAAKENKLPWAHKIQIRNKADGVYLVNKELLPEEEPEDAGAVEVGVEDDDDAEDAAEAYANANAEA